MVLPPNVTLDDDYATADDGKQTCKRFAYFRALIAAGKHLCFTEH